jgi:hypothetical protein
MQQQQCGGVLTSLSHGAGASRAEFESAIYFFNAHPCGIRTTRIALHFRLQAIPMRCFFHQEFSNAPIICITLCLGKSVLTECIGEMFVSIF